MQASKRTSWKACKRAKSVEQLQPPDPLDKGGIRRMVTTSDPLKKGKV